VRVCEDLVDGRFLAAGRDRLWVADITYLRTSEGWLYLVAVQHVYSRRIVGRSTATCGQNSSSTPCRGARAAPARSRSDLALRQGQQFVSLAFGQQARAAGIAQSMGSRGDCYDTHLG